MRPNAILASLAAWNGKILKDMSSSCAILTLHRNVFVLSEIPLYDKQGQKTCMQMQTPCDKKGVSETSLKEDVGYRDTDTQAVETNYLNHKSNLESPAFCHLKCQPLDQKSCKKPIFKVNMA